MLGLLGPPEAQAAVIDAFDAANRIGLVHLEQRAAAARKGKAGERRIGVHGWTVASFLHLTSRALDPFVHRHNVIANSVRCADDRRRTLDARGLYLTAPAASALATIEMRHRLTATLGVDWRRTDRGTWEIAGIADDVLDAFRQRRSDILDAVEELVDQLGHDISIDTLQTVVTSTRPAKTAADPRDLIGEWRRRATDLGLTPQALSSCLGRRGVDYLDDTTLQRLVEHLAGPDGITAHSSTFTRGDVLAAIADYAEHHPDTAPRLLVIDAATAERIADQFLASPAVIRLDTTATTTARVVRRDGRIINPAQPEALYSTVEMLRLQQRVLDAVDHHQADRAGLVDTALVETAIAADGTLADEQEELVRAWCASGHRVQCAVGGPGTGKTHTVAVAARAWTAAGYRVAGAAVKGEAARNLGDTAIASETLAWYLAHPDPERHPLDGRTVLVVDEASTIPDRDLDALIQLCAHTGTTLRLLGDPAQHGAIRAGGLFGLVCARHTRHTPELALNRRLQHAADTAAARALRAGDIDGALDHLTAAGHLTVSADGDHHVHATMLARWWHQRRAGRPHPMIDRRNRNRRVLNDLAHALRTAAGELQGPEIIGPDGRRFTAGDEVVARRGNRTLYPAGHPDRWLRNGTLGTIVEARPDATGAENDELVVDFAGTGIVTLSRCHLDRPPGGGDVGVDHAYALTSYAVQGLTFDAATAHLDPSATRAEAYVDVTRGRTENVVIISGRPDLVDGDRLPRAPEPPALGLVAASLARSGPERAAADIDPTALDAARSTGLTLAELTAARLDAVAGGDDDTAGLLARAERAEADRISCTAVSILLEDPELSRRLPPRPAVPWQREQWDTAARALVVYRARWHPPPHTGPWGWAIGPAGANAEHAADADRVKTAIVAAVGAQCLPADAPLWAVEIVEAAAAGGKSHDPCGLAALITELAAWAAEHGSEPMSPHNLDPGRLCGPRPTDSTARAHWEELVARLRGLAMPAASPPRRGPSRDR